MGSCCGKRDIEPTERTHLLSSDDKLLDKAKVQDDETKEDVKIFKSSDKETNKIPSVFDTHSHRKIPPSVLIHYCIRDTFKNKSQRLPDLIIDIISNYIMKQNISSIICVADATHSNESYFDISTNNKSIVCEEETFHFDGIYHNQNDQMFGIEFSEVCDNFLNGFNVSCLCFGKDSILKNMLYSNYMHQNGLLYHCIDYILKNVINCCLFIKIYGIASSSNDGKDEEFVDLLCMASDVLMCSEFENRMLLNMECFNHLMIEFSNNLRQYKAKNENNIIIVFELSLQRILGDDDDAINTKFANILSPMMMNANEHILGPMELQVSTFQIVDVGRVNAIHLIESSPKTKLFQQLSKRIRSKNKSLLNVWDIFKYFVDCYAGEVNDEKLDKMKNNSLLTKKMCESFGGNCRTLLLGFCQNEESEKQNLMTLFRLAKNAMNIVNHPCINRFRPG